MLIETLKNNPVDYSYKIYNHPEIIHHANHILKPKGSLSFVTASNFCYLKISDNYIYDAFSILKNIHLSIPIMIPDYFTEEKNNIGAHISLVYPDENNANLVKNYIESSRFINTFNFRVNELISVDVFNKTLFALTVTCSKLEKIRKKFDLPEKLNYQGLLVPFHITIATSRND